MKLVISTPGIFQSAIGKMAFFVSEELLNLGYTVTFVRTEDVSLLAFPTHSSNAKIISWKDPEVISILQEADSLIYHIGDNYQFHRGCLEWLPKFPGIICLHDFFLGNLFYGWALHHPQEALHIINIWYGKEFAKPFFSLAAHCMEEFIEETHNKTPMTEWIAAMANGIITHSSWGIERILKACPGPVYSVPLPYPRPAEFSFSEPTPKEKLFTILTFGNINPNKRAASIIQAIAKSSLLREKVNYRLAGFIAPKIKEKLNTLAENLNVNLSILGEVNEADLYQELKQAEIICCLRFPALEASSASTIEALFYEKAILVSNVGFYQELPDHLVYKINPEHEIDEIKEKLEFLYQHSDHRIQIGRQAGEWANKTFNVNAYAQELIRICSSTSKTAPFLKSTLYFSQLLAKWNSFDETLETIPNLSEKLSIFSE